MREIVAQTVLETAKKRIHHQASRKSLPATAVTERLTRNATVANATDGLDDRQIMFCQVVLSSLPTQTQYKATNTAGVNLTASFAFTTRVSFKQT
jgi:hypothetical protein